MNEAELLLTDLLGCSGTDLALRKKEPLGSCLGSRMASVLQRRYMQEPFQYIMGTTEFMGLPFAVSDSVLIPRPETEVLVEKVIELYKNRKDPRILDIGTGSGCIAVSLAKNLPHAALTATDVSGKALSVAKENAARLGVSVRFIHADLFPVSSGTDLFDCIVSNPPYIPTDEIKTLQPEVQREPRSALDGGPDGLDFYRRIMKGARTRLVASGILIMEMGFGQSRAIGEFCAQSGICIVRQIVKDYAGIDRVIVVQYI